MLHTVAGIPDEKSDSAALPFSGHRLDPFRIAEGVNACSPARAARTGLAEPLVGDSTVATSVSLEIDAKLSQFDDCRSAPADRVRGEREREGHPVLLAERLAVAQDVVVAGRRFDGEAGGLESADEFADVFPHLTV